MRVDLLKHNQEAYEKVKLAITEGKKKIAIAHATGTGKSYLIAKLFEDYSNEKKLVLVPSTYIGDQMQGLFEKYSIQNVDVILYQKLIKMSDEDIAAMDYGVIALDEYHHDTSKVWGNKVRKLIDTHPESIIFGTSATPVRSDGINTIDELFEGNCASDLPLSESIAKKIVPLPKYVGALYKLDDELERLRKKVEQATNTKEEKQEFYRKINTMRAQIEKSYGMPIILNKYIKDKEGKYIVFCKNKRHLKEIMETVIGWFKTAGCKNINSYIVHSSYENKDAEYKAFCKDTSHSLHLLFCVDMLNEGLHLENISGVLLLRPTRSSIVWHQQIGRAIEANNTNTPVIIDAVNNFSAVGQGMELMREIKDSVAREKESDPDFDDSWFEEIDTFFVLEQVVEIQEMFKEIEGRLKGDWENGLKHFDKYVNEHDGDVLVPLNYRDEDGFLLGSWVSHRRRDFGNERLSLEKIEELERRGFVWDVLKHNFEKNVNDCKKFYEKYGRLPSQYSKNKIEKKLMKNIISYKHDMSKYPQWKQDLLKKIPTLFDNKSCFDKFYDMALIYKQRYGHVDIKCTDIIDGYRIGNIYNNLIQDFKNEKLSIEQVEKLKGINIDITKGKLEKQFDARMQLIEKALNEGVVISYKNQTYKGFNFYNWYHSHKNVLSGIELENMQKLVPDRNKKAVNIIELENGHITTYSSIGEAGEALYSDFHVVNDEKQGFRVISRRLIGGTKSPVYKGLCFKYADGKNGDDKAI